MGMLVKVKAKSMNGMQLRFLKLIGALFFLFTVICSYQNANHFTHMNIGIILACIGGLGLIWLAAHLAAWQISNRVFVAILLCMAVGTRLAWVLTVDTPPVSDFLFMHTAALGVTKGDFIFRDSEYFVTWAYQIGFTLYQALLIKLFGTPLIVLKLYNIAFSVGTAWLLYLIAVQVFNEFCGRITLFFYVFYTPNIILCSVLTNQHIATFLFVLGSYFVVHKGLATTYNWILMGLCYGIANLFRPLGSFYIGCFAVYFILFELFAIQKKWRVQRLTKMLGMMVVYLIVQQLVNIAFVNTSFIQTSLTNKEPYWKFVVGLNPSTVGTWSIEDDHYVDPYPIGPERNQVELEMIKMRLTDKSQLVALFIKKFGVLWGAADSSVNWTLGEADRPILAAILIVTECLAYILMAFLGMIAVLALFRKKEYPKSSFFLLLLVGYAGLHLIIEIQTRYRFDIMPCIFILQSYGVYVLYSKRQKKKRPTTSGATEEVSLKNSEKRSYC
ncbi:glycosyltransferase family 39 protein [Paenibacillus sp. N3.4]|uniref:glycosyltransferase family 39 protein n=1 Tax=Paenibacillus sp. N3.4 TaxID=2603222 RepID=UPI00164F7E80|nr:glycosyltransferase family 39 protein [Paenibacillus sp. N3.4]